MKILMLGDVVGKSGKNAIKKILEGIPEGKNNIKTNTI